MSCFSSCNLTHSSWSARCPSTAAERCERSAASALLRSGRCFPYVGRCPYEERSNSRWRACPSATCFSSASTYLQVARRLGVVRCGGLMGMGKRGAQRETHHSCDRPVGSARPEGIGDPRSGVVRAEYGGLYIKAVARRLRADCGRAAARKPTPQPPAIGAANSARGEANPADVYAA